MPEGLSGRRQDIFAADPHVPQQPGLGQRAVWNLYWLETLATREIDRIKEPSQSIVQKIQLFHPETPPALHATLTRIGHNIEIDFYVNNG